MDGIPASGFGRNENDIESPDDGRVVDHCIWWLGYETTLVELAEQYGTETLSRTVDVWGVSSCAHVPGLMPRWADGSLVIHMPMRNLNWTYKDHLKWLEYTAEQFIHDDYFGEDGDPIQPISEDDPTIRLSLHMPQQKDLTRGDRWRRIARIKAALTKPPRPSDPDICTWTTSTNCRMQWIGSGVSAAKK
jgi:hypothetical protein